jgi:hypothetical protein
VEELLKCSRGLYLAVEGRLAPFDESRSILCSFLSS